MVKCLSTMRETRVWSLGWEDPLEKEMAIHSRTIAWKIPWAEVGYSPWGHKELDTTERLHFHLPPVIPHEYSLFSQHRMHHMFFDLNDLFLFFPLLSGLYSTMMSFWAFASSHGWTDPRVSRWLINLVFDTWVLFIWHLLKIFSRVRFLYWCVLNWVYE